MEKIAQAWAKKTGNTVKFNGHPDNEQNKLCVDGPSGNGEDLIGVPHDQLSVMVNCKTLAPVPSWAWPPSLQKKYITAALQATNLNGKYYAMPWAIETTGLFYNKALISSSAFKAKGKVLPWTSLIPKLQKLTNPSSDRYGLGWKMDDFYYDYGTIAATGGYVFKYTKKGFDYRDIGLDSAGAIKGISFIRDISTIGKYKLVPATFTGANGFNEMETLFDSGKLAVFLTGPWSRAKMDSSGVNYGFAPMPSVDGKNPSHQFSGVQAFAVNAFSKNQNEAFALLSYMTQEMQLPEFKSQLRLPVLKSLLSSKLVQSNPFSKGLAAAAANARPMPNIPEMGQVWTPMANALTLVVQGKMDPATAAHQAVAKIKSDIAKLHGG
jgi:arabinogalactan oligomer/maltooligosaccharide transport system substrate-binding protein